ncbi:MAG: glycerol-3-phosphate dehydrogenase subunit GlpB [Desulfobacterales bacterium]|nr:glycerol-3-phosphate dehydrogenase subunit GlpB [Desulfobacterales bacterium]
MHNSNGDNRRQINCQLAVIGSGTAGMAASIFAAGRGLSVIQAGRSAELSFSSGCLDLFSTLPGDPVRRFENPFEGIETLVGEQPDHPYSRVSRDEIVHGFEEFTAFMARAGIKYHCSSLENQKIITPAGTLKSCWCVPSPFHGGTRALAEKKKTLIVDIRGLKGFGARQMVEKLGKVHSGFGSITIEFPGRENAGDLMCERLTWDLENPAIFKAFIRRLRPHVAGYEALGLPAILGIYRFEALREQLEEALGVSVFEIPTLSPSVTGMRAKEAFARQLNEAKVRQFPCLVKDVRVDGAGMFCFQVSQGMDTLEVRAESLILATGRFLGKGLGVNPRGRIKEMLFNIPVTQPGDRDHWFNRDFFGKHGHVLNRAGLETDPVFRPLERDGELFHPRLYACGSILAHQDWKREKSGSGISIASAYKAVSHLSSHLDL